MKLEIAVRTPDAVAEKIKNGSSKVKVEKLLVKPGDTVQAGAHIALLRMGS